MNRCYVLQQIRLVATITIFCSALSRAIFTPKGNFFFVFLASNGWDILYPCLFALPPIWILMQFFINVHNPSILLLPHCIYRFVRLFVTRITLGFTRLPRSHPIKKQLPKVNYRVYCPKSPAVVFLERGERFWKRSVSDLKGLGND